MYMKHVLLTVVFLGIACVAMKNYKGFIIQFDEFCKAKRKRFDFGDIDLKFYDDFVY